MNTAEKKYDLHNDPELVKYWMKQGPKTAAFLLVIPGPAVTGFGVGLLMGNPIPYSIMGLGLGLLAWGLVVALTD
jgi:hypothetical protein